MPDSAQERKTESRDWCVERKAEDSDSCNLLQIGLQILNRGREEDACQHNFSDCSAPFAAQVCSLQAARSLSGFARPALSPLLREL
jgi:hypothetical protein